MADGTEPSLTGLAASLSAFGDRRADDERLLEDLLQQLRSGLGRNAVKLARRGLWGFGRIESIAVTIGNVRYQVSMVSQVLVCTTAPAAGGIGVGSRTEMPWSAWIDQLSRALSKR